MQIFIFKKIDSSIQFSNMFDLITRLLHEFIQIQNLRLMKIAPFFMVQVILRETRPIHRIINQEEAHSTKVSTRISMKKKYLEHQVSSLPTNTVSKFDMELTTQSHRT